MSGQPHVLIKEEGEASGIEGATKITLVKHTLEKIGRNNQSHKPWRPFLDGSAAEVVTPSISLRLLTTNPFQDLGTSI